MQEYPKLVVKFGREVGIMRLPDWMASRPVKNNLVDAKIKYEKVGSAMCASSGEAGIYFLARQYLRAAKVNVEEPGVARRIFRRSRASGTLLHQHNYVFVFMGIFLG